MRRINTAKSHKYPKKRKSNQISSEVTNIARYTLSDR